RPRHSTWPDRFHRARSPVRYIRSPAPPNGHRTNPSPAKPGRPRYPPASPAPATYNSPATPGGTKPRCSSSTNTCVFHTGRPIGGTPEPPSGPDNVAAIVISVGPYALNIRRPADHRPASRSEHASPPTIRHPNPRTRPAGTLASAVGTISAWLTSSSSSASASTSPASTPRPGSGTTSTPPAGHAISTSITA